MATRRIENPEQYVYEWLQESTGRALCDSGGAYGRHWERNRKLDLEKFKAQQATVEIEILTHKDDTKNVYINPIIPMYKFLVALVENNFVLDEKTDAYDKWLAEADYDSWELGENGFFTADEAVEAAGLVVEKTINTYNDEYYTSQVMQYSILKDPETDERYIGISIHQGCDVRGGYTQGRLFKLENSYGNAVDSSCAINPAPDVYASYADLNIDARVGDIQFYDNELQDEVNDEVAIERFLKQYQQDHPEADMTATRIEVEVEADFDTEYILLDW